MQLLHQGRVWGSIDSPSLEERTDKDKDIPILSQREFDGRIASKFAEDRDLPQPAILKPHRQAVQLNVALAQRAEPEPEQEVMFESSASSASDESEISNLAAHLARIAPDPDVDTISFPQSPSPNQVFFFLSKLHRN